MDHKACYSKEIFPQQIMQSRSSMNMIPIVCPGRKALKRDDTCGTSPSALIPFIAQGDRFLCCWLITPLGCSASLLPYNSKLVSFPDISSLILLSYLVHILTWWSLVPWNRVASSQPAADGPDNSVWKHGPSPRLFLAVRQKDWHLDVHWEVEKFLKSIHLPKNYLFSLWLQS